MTWASIHKNNAMRNLESMFAADGHHLNMDKI